MPWRAGAGGGVAGGYELGLLMRGVHGAEEMFAAAASTNAAWKWGLRAAGAPAACCMWPPRVHVLLPVRVRVQRVHVKHVHTADPCTTAQRCSAGPCTCSPVQVRSWCGSAGRSS